MRAPQPGERQGCCASCLQGLRLPVWAFTWGSAEPSCHALFCTAMLCPDLACFLCSCLLLFIAVYCVHLPQEIAELTVQKERLQRGADALEKKRGVLLAQIAALKEARPAVGLCRTLGCARGPAAECLAHCASHGHVCGTCVMHVGGTPSCLSSSLAAAAGAAQAVPRWPSWHVVCRRAARLRASWAACRSRWTRWRPR